MRKNERNSIKGFIMIPDKVLEDEDLTCFAKLVYGVVLSYAREKNYCFASNGHLKAKLKKDITTISRALSQLENKGYIKRTFDKNGFRKAYIVYEAINDNQTENEEIFIGSEQKRLDPLAELPRAIGKNAKDNIEDIILDDNIKNIIIHSDNIIKAEKGNSFFEFIDIKEYIFKLFNQYQDYDHFSILRILTYPFSNLSDPEIFDNLKSKITNDGLENFLTSLLLSKLNTILKDFDNCNSLMDPSHINETSEFIAHRSSRLLTLSFQDSYHKFLEEDAQDIITEDKSGLHQYKENDTIEINATLIFIKEINGKKPGEKFGSLTFLSESNEKFYAQVTSDQYIQLKFDLKKLIKKKIIIAGKVVYNTHLKQNILRSNRTLDFIVQPVNI